MPIAIIIIAVCLIAVGIRGTYQQLSTLIAGDFTGSQNFLNWLVAIGIVGCLGYVPALEKFSRAFIALIVLAMFLKQGSGLYAQFTSAISGAQGSDSVALGAAGSVAPLGASQAPASGDLVGQAVTGVLGAIKGAVNPTATPSNTPAPVVPGSINDPGNIGMY